MHQNLPTKELIIAVVEKDGTILMRKKPVGSPPYKETWYLFGCDRSPDQYDAVAIRKYLKDVVGIEVDIAKKSIPASNEIKKDHDGVEKNFIYINLLCKFVSGEPKVPHGAEKIEWIRKDKLYDYDIVPPTVKLFKSLGYLN